MTENYYLTKRNDDAVLNNNQEQVKMIMYRDSDTVEKELVPSHASGCGFDRLSHNPLLFNQKRDAFINNNPFEIADPMAGMKKFGGSIDIGKTLLSKRAPQGCPTSKKSKVVFQ